MTKEQNTIEEIFKKKYGMAVTWGKETYTDYKIVINNNAKFSIDKSIHGNDALERQCDAIHALFYFSKIKLK